AGVILTTPNDSGKGYSMPTQDFPDEQLLPHRDIPQPLFYVLQKAAAQKKEERYQSAGAFRQALMEIRDDVTKPREPYAHLYGNTLPQNERLENKNTTNENEMSAKMEQFSSLTSLRIIQEKGGKLFESVRPILLGTIQFVFWITTMLMLHDCTSKNGVLETIKKFHKNHEQYLRPETVHEKDSALTKAKQYLIATKHYSDSCMNKIYVSGYADNELLAETALNLRQEGSIFDGGDSKQSISRILTILRSEAFSDFFYHRIGKSDRPKNDMLLAEMDNIPITAKKLSQRADMLREEQSLLGQTKDYLIKPFRFDHLNLDTNCIYSLEREIRDLNFLRKNEIRYIIEVGTVHDVLKQRLAYIYLFQGEYSKADSIYNSDKWYSSYKDIHTQLLNDYEVLRDKNLLGNKEILIHLAEASYKFSQRAKQEQSSAKEAK
ncbi:MAG: hypothetical protein ACOVSW_11310, partial [Candidatus Kapaibacteriota bacterium]